MKKRIIPIITVVCLCLLLAFTATGCSGESYAKIKVEGKQDTTYVVHSQGGGAVQYGNYVYFINGYSGYDDTDSKQNIWSKVTKGALYRAELNGKKAAVYEPKADGTPSEKLLYNDFVIEGDDQAVNKGLEFKYTSGKNNDDEDIDIINVQLIAPKRVGTTGYNKGGIFIYDEWVYFASPNNKQDKKGNSLASDTEFFRAKLDGSKVQKIYSTEKGGNSSNAYAFYKYNGSVYLVARDGTDLVSVKVDKKPGNKVIISKNVSDVLLPYSETYYNGMSENTPEHFVYVMRSAGEGDTQTSGNVIEIMRPDGKNGAVIHSQGKSDSLEAVRDGLFFYRTTDDSNYTHVKFDSLHEVLYVSDSQYKKATDEGKVKRTQFSGEVLSTASISDYTSTYCFRPGGEASDLVYMIGVKSDSMEVYSNLAIRDGSYSLKFNNETGSILNVVGEYVYYNTTSSNAIKRKAWDPSYVGLDGYLDVEQVSGDSVSATPYIADYCAGYIVYIGKVDDLADSYTFFRTLSPRVEEKPLFVGKIIDSDKLLTPSIKIKKGVISWNAVNNAESYDVYYSSPNGDITLAEKGVTATSYKPDNSVAGTYQYWIVARFGELKSAKSNTVSYKV